MNPTILKRLSETEFLGFAKTYLNTRQFAGTMKTTTNHSLPEATVLSAL